MSNTPLLVVASALSVRPHARSFGQRRDDVTGDERVVEHADVDRRQRVVA